MQIVRFHDTPAGGSAFEEIDVAFSDPFVDEFGNTYHLSRTFGALDAVFVELPDGLDQGWHNAPTRQLVMVLSGTIEVETTQGDKRRWQQGGAFIADDVSGRGHLTKVFDGPARLVFLRLPDDFDPTRLARGQKED